MAFKSEQSKSKMKRYLIHKLNEPYLSTPQLQNITTVVGISSRPSESSRLSWPIALFECCSQVSVGFGCCRMSCWKKARSMQCCCTRGGAVHVLCLR